EVGLDDARGRVDRSSGRLADDPVDVAGGELLLRPGRGTQLRRGPGGAERGAPGVAQETAPVDLRLYAHLVLLSPWPAAPATRVPGAAMPRDTCRAHFGTRSVLARCPARRDRWYGSKFVRLRDRGPSFRPIPARGFRHGAARARTGPIRSSA